MELKWGGAEIMNDYSVFNSVNRISDSDWARICDALKAEPFVANGTIVFKDGQSMLVLCDDIIGFEVIVEVEQNLNFKEIADGVIVLISEYDRASRKIWGKTVPPALLSIFENNASAILCISKVIKSVTDLVNSSKSMQELITLLKNCDYSSEELKKAVPYEIRNMLSNEDAVDYLKKAIVFVTKSNKEVYPFDMLEVARKIQVENEKALNKYIAIVNRIHWSHKSNQYIGFLGWMATEYGFVSVLINFPQTYFLSPEAGDILDVTIDKIKGIKIFCNIYKPDKIPQKSQNAQKEVSKPDLLSEISMTEKDEKVHKSPFIYCNGERIEVEENGDGKAAFIKIVNRLNNEHNQILKYIAIFRCVISPQVKLLYDLGMIESEKEKPFKKVQDILVDLNDWGLLTRGIFKVNNKNPNIRIYALSERGKYYLTEYMKYFKNVPFSTSELVSRGPENVKRFLACNQAILAFAKYFKNLLFNFSIGNVYTVDNISNAIVRPSVFITLEGGKSSEDSPNKASAFVEVLRNNPGYENIIVEKFPRYKKLIDNYQDMRCYKEKMNLTQKPFMLIVGEDEQHNRRSYEKIREVLGEKSGITIVYSEDRLIFEKFNESHYMISNDGERNLVKMDDIFALSNE